MAWHTVQRDGSDCDASSGGGDGDDARGVEQG